MKLVRNALVALSLASVAGLALANTKTPNCEIKGKKEHVKDQAACTKKKGTWIEEGATAHAPAPEAAAPEAAPAAAPATTK